MKTNKFVMLFLILITIFIPVITYIFNINFLLIQLTMSIYYTLVSLGLCILMGYAGQISLGQAAFFAIGGYTTGVLTTMNFINIRENYLINFLIKCRILTFDKGFYGEVIYFSPFVALIIAILISILIAYFIGFAVLKLKGHYLAMATLGFNIIVYKIIKGTKFLGQADGISAIPGFKILPFLVIDGSNLNRITNFYFASFLLLFVTWLFFNLINSRSGLALRSLHGDEDASNAMGINVTFYKRAVFVLAAVTASVSGFFLTHYNGAIGPSEASIIKSVRYVSIVAVGGMGNIWGVLFSGIILNFLSLRGVFGRFDDAVFGIILIIIMSFAPHGIFNKELIFEIYNKSIKILVSKFKKDN